MGYNPLCDFVVKLFLLQRGQSLSQSNTKEKVKESAPIID